MEVIVIESTAFYKLLEEAKNYLTKSSSSETYIEEADVMKLFHIKNKSHFSQFRSKHQIPCYRVDRSYIYKRNEIETFITKHKSNKH